MYHVPAHPRPTLERRFDTAAKNLLDESAEQLVAAARHLRAESPDYAGAAKSALRSIRRAYESILVWHGRPVSDELPFQEVGRLAEDLVSILRTSRKMSVPVESLVRSFESGAAGTDVTTREGTATSYYTARNTLATVISLLPERVHRDAMAKLDEARNIAG